ncbi:MAG: hypothetical protein AAF371_11775 [Pseudomonadota bacterium]
MRQDAPKTDGPFYVFLVADWEREDTWVEVTTDVVYLLPGEMLYGPPDDAPRRTRTGGPCRAGAKALVRIERFEALDRARLRARELTRWPIGWCRAACGALWPFGLDARALLRETRGGRRPVHSRFLAHVDDAAAPVAKLPRREGWFDGDRPA